MFVVALAVGQTLSSSNLETIGMILLALAVLATVSCVIEFEANVVINRWTPVAEGVLAAVLIGAADAPVAPLLVYLAVPPVVAGVRHGWVTTANTALAIGIALMGSYVAADALGLAAPQIRASLPWLFVGLGAGLLAAWLTRSVRALEETQAPYAAAHRLLSQLRAVSQTLPGGLDSQTVAHRIVEQALLECGAERTTLFLRSSKRALVAVAEAGTAAAQPDTELKVAQLCLGEKQNVQRQCHAALTMRVGDHLLGAIVLFRASRWRDSDLLALQEAVDGQSIQLDTALLFDDVRNLATSEERNRLAREIHDGVAQDVASLGYLIDDLAANSADPETQTAAAGLRQEVTRVVSELRLSIFDLRHGIGDAGGLAGALSEYVREVSARSALRVHLLLDEQGTPLPPKTRAELLRIGQEAITNARKHAQAINLWVTLTTDGRQARLRIEDDGLGLPIPRPHHYGLQTMRERAERINAEFTIGNRVDGGTIVTVEIRATPREQGANDADKRATR